MGKEIAAWKSAKAQAEKIIGKQGKLPKPKADVVASMDAVNKAAAKLLAERDAMEGSVLALRDAFSKVANAAESYSDIVDANDFNLDEDDKEQAKKIEATKGDSDRRLIRDNGYARYVLH